MPKEILAGGLHGLTIEDFFPTNEVWADEDELALNKLKTALLADLDPRTPYQHVIAENLVELEWEKLRYRRMRDALLKAEVREKAAEALSGKDRFYIPADSEYIETARDLISGDLPKRKSAEKILSENGISTSEVLAKAHQKCLRDLAYFETQIAEVETRRRKLRLDYDFLKAEQATLIEDADSVIDA